MPGLRPNTEHTFEEIGLELGVTRQRAEAIFRNGIRKLRSRHPVALCALRELARERQRERNQRALTEIKR